MCYNVLMKILREIPIPASSTLLKGMDDGECRILFDAVRADAICYERGESVIRQGDPVGPFFLLISGEVHAYVEHPCGRRNVDAVAYPGDVVGLLGAYSFLSAHTNRMEAVKDTVAIRFPSFQMPMRDDIVPRRVEKCLVANMLAAVSWGASLVRFRSFVISHKSIETRVSLYLEKKASLSGRREFCIPFDRQELAEYLAVDRSALSSVLGRMRSERKIAFKKSRFRLLKRLTCADA